MSEHAFDLGVALTPVSEGLYEGHTQPLWANMVGPFGGITAATLLNAAVIDPRRLGDPLALTVNYAAAPADGPFTVHAEPVRTNRSTQHWVITQRQGEVVNTTATAVFARRRSTWGEHEARMPDVLPAEQVAPAPRRSRMTWVQHYDLRFAFGPWPDFANNPPADPDSESAAWMRDQPERPLDMLSLAALCDLFYPRIFRRRPRVVPIGTVSMSVYFHASAAELARVGSQHVLGCARGRRYTQGFFDHSGEIFAPTGELLASTHQLVYYKE